MDLLYTYSQGVIIARTFRGVIKNSFCPYFAYRIKSVVFLSLVAIVLVVCSNPDAQNNSQRNQTQQQASKIANPASENCINQGGKLVIEKRGDGGEYGICLFEDNRQCEEWAMLQGTCPVGGIKVTGYVTAAAQYCAITGGVYTITSNSNTEDEQGVCLFKNGEKCDVREYYKGKCSPNT